MTDDNNDDGNGFTEPDPDRDALDGIDGPGDFEAAIEDEEPDGEDEDDDGLGSPPASSDGDDPWSNVKSEDELRQTASTPSHERSEDAGGDGGSEDSDAKSDEEQAFAERLRDTLRRNGFDTGDLPAITGLTRDEAGRIKSGAVTPTESTQQSILEAIEKEGPKRRVEPDDSTETEVSDEAEPPRDGEPQTAEAVNAEQDQPSIGEGSQEETWGGPMQGLSDNLRAAASQLDMLEDLERFEGDLSEFDLVAPDTSCSNCSHRHTCIILSSFAPKLADANWDAGTEEEGSPIDPMDFAAICDAYDPEGDGHVAPTQTQ